MEWREISGAELAEIIKNEREVRNKHVDLPPMTLAVLMFDFGGGRVQTPNATKSV
jgi:hypothetical protein